MCLTDRLGLYPSISTYKKKKLTVLTIYQEKYVWRLKVFLLNSVSFTLQEFSSMATLISFKTHQRMPFGFIRWNYYENSLGSIQCLKISNNVSLWIYTAKIFLLLFVSLIWLICQLLIYFFKSCKMIFL